MIRIAEDGSEWKMLVGEEDGFLCASETHAPDCDRSFAEAHHMVFLSQITGEPNARWIVENGIALSEPCHKLAHATHNVSVGLDRANRGVAAVNLILAGRGRTKIPPFRKKTL